MTWGNRNRHDPQQRPQLRPDGRRVRLPHLISWATNAAVVVEASPVLATPIWTAVSTNTLTAGTSRFTDPQWTNHPVRVYRVTAL